MTTAYVVAGRLTPQGTLDLDERPPLPPGPVRVSLEPAQVPKGLVLDISDEELQARKALIEAAIGCLSDEEAQQILEAVETAFGQVNPDAWG